MHGPAPPPGAALLLAEHFRHDGGHRHTAKERVRVFAIGCDDGIVGFQCAQSSRGDGFLADIQVQESTNLAFAVELCAALLHPSYADHVREEHPGGVGIGHDITGIPQVCAFPRQWMCHPRADRVHAL